MFGLGPTELILIAVIVLLIFGAKRLPEIGKGVGGALKEFRKVRKELSTEENSVKPEEGDKKLEDKENPPNPEAKVVDKVVDKVLDQVPPVKKAVEIKKKADQVKKIIT